MIDWRKLKSYFIFKNNIYIYFYINEDELDELFHYAIGGHLYHYYKNSLL